MNTTSHTTGAHTTIDRSGGRVLLQSTYYTGLGHSASLLLSLTPYEAREIAAHLLRESTHVERALKTAG